MLGKAMRFATMCTWSFAICGKANRHNVAAVSNATIEDFEHRVGNETNFEDHSSTTKTVTSTPIRKTSSTGSSTQVRRLAKILLLGSSVFSAAASAPRGVQPAGFRALQQDGNIDLEHLALNVPVGGILGRTSWEKYELVLGGFEAALQGWEEQHKGDLGPGWGWEDRELKHHERPFGAGRKLKIRGPKDKASGLSGSNTKASPSKHKILIRANQLFEKFLWCAGIPMDMWILIREGKYVDSHCVQEVLDMDKFLQTPGWLDHVFTRPSVIEFMPLFTWMISPRLHPSEQGNAGMEENLKEDRMKAIDIMTDA